MTYPNQYLKDEEVGLVNAWEKFLGQPFGYNLTDIASLQTSEARKKLLLLQGVGPKVADCILLFSMNKKDVFPIDTWIEKVMKKYFSDNRLNKKHMQELVNNEFGEFKGIINHYMFYWGRENKL